MKKKKGYNQSCAMNSGRVGSKSAKKGSKQAGGVIDDVTVSKIYRRYYKNQLAALYRAVKSD